MRMNLSMLGSDYRYAFEPVSGDSYVKANGCGYVQGSYGLGDSLQDAADDWIGTYGNMNLSTGEVRVIPKSAYDTSVETKAKTYGVRQKDLYDRIISTVNKIKSSLRVTTTTTGLNNVSSILDSLSKGVISVAEAIAASKGLSKKDQDKIKDEIGLAAYLPWIIGGGAVLVGLFMVMGTRKARHSY